MIRLLIADDQAVVRTGLAVILGAEPDIEVVGQAADGEEAVQLARRLRPDVVCMDIRMPVKDGIEATREITADPDLQVDVLVLTTFDVDADVFAALDAGAAGFLLKGADERTLAAAVRSVAAGEGTLDQRLTRRILHEFVANRRSAPSSRPSAPSTTPLTDREVDVLRLLAEGLSNAEIAARLFVEPTTVKYHLAGLLQKTASRDRLQAALWGIRAGVVDP
ncbi:response regulator transcription factor [Microbacterium sp. zg.Y625]|uniref:response regulator transcription factor n=1 Tax=Microbacterium jiangjiandongii TaxID=3049071 RepID=UPI00214AC19E|nr:MULTISPECIES: response regulator transcription factor [unclassified Microbacterium]MCR2792856.1 response regulator transcription factor [Microbacterium sp. zg.Y625]WIM26828.1 response regulator transcription factor [Microbacterium sp. zg-Y625]